MAYYFATSSEGNQVYTREHFQNSDAQDKEAKCKSDA